VVLIKLIHPVSRFSLHFMLEWKYS